MSKDFAEIAHDVIAGVGLLQRGVPDCVFQRKAATDSN